MNCLETAIPGVLILEPKVFGDARGFFMETWQSRRYAELGLPDLVQDNLARSARGVLRGLHVQHPHAQGKLVQVLEGQVFDVAVDIRRDSPWYGQSVGVTLSGERPRQFWIPPGFAHGYYVTSDTALFAYKCSDYYHPEAELAVRWDDPDLAIAWPLAGAPRLSDKDRDAARLAEIPAEGLPSYEAARG
ncbi:dTDP-4-dehydrorhamnose 3,5-epimerase [Thioflavicoccus mobilis 8321]|uniref:dTDP-4-dehydrorhamnose 3,5-epimerase n=1 Tax=Thioflavicoccus mobilis 8321 TaxID=765912 RepID=L0H0I9_9GAMM|nr:dTDP-4-dehydrorhamnose 3,5-epimerase [Thioflavicoccus mobilis]AGA91741.1 dTDP-4-dehydrorhamnose 3,5-epimerase [Thioflavicoccus mobilis 8321]